MYHIPFHVFLVILSFPKMFLPRPVVLYVLSLFIQSQSSTFSVPWLGMSAMGTLYKTPLALLDQARSCCSPSHLHSPGHTQLYRSANSFHIFLRVLALCLAQDGAGGVPQRQIKGR